MCVPIADLARWRSADRARARRAPEHDPECAKIKMTAETRDQNADRVISE